MCVCLCVCGCLMLAELGVARTGAMMDCTNEKGNLENKNDSESSFQTLSHCLGWWSVCVCLREVGGWESVPPDVHSIPSSPPYPDTQTWWGRDAEGGWLYQTQRQPRFRTSRHQLSVSHKGISLTHFFLTKDSLSLSQLSVGHVWHQVKWAMCRTATLIFTDNTLNNLRITLIRTNLGL